MKEKFEHRITNRINEVFDSHHADFNPQDWEKLKAQLPEKKSRIAVVFWTIAKVAAVILLFLAGIYLFWDQQSIDDTVVEKRINQSPKETLSKNAFVDTIINQIPEISTMIERNRTEDFDETKTEYDQQIETSESVSKLIADILIENKPHKSASDISRQLGQMNTPNAENRISQQIAVSTATHSNEIIPDTISVDMDREVPQFISPLTKPKKEKVKLGVEMATFTNYSKDNINPSMNYGGGIAANIPIKNRFSFNPALVFSAYNMELQDNQSLLSKQDFGVYTTSGMAETRTATELQLTAMDIPMNFQYQFIKRKKSNYFLELGFSSLLYLSQNYSYELTYIDNSGCPPGTVCDNMVTVNEESSIPDYKTFDFAKFLNFSVGLDYHLSKRFDMVINPYLKYPVNLLSEEELKFGSGGLKLKFMIVPKK